MDGRDWTLVDRRLLEVEEYVEHDRHMNTWERVEAGLPILGRMHHVLKSIGVSPDSKVPQFVNYVASENVPAATARGVARIRSWSPAPAEARLADAADELAKLVTAVQRSDRLRTTFLADNMGERARIDDLA